MKQIKKIVIGFFAILLLTLIIGFFYFDRKFSPEKNYLIVKNESGKIKITWLDESKNALLLPIHFKNDSTRYYIQFDTGSPYTVFYKNAIKKIPNFQTKNNIANGAFEIGKTEIKSDKFKIIDFGKDTDNTNIKIIGTLGADILENRKTIINLKNNFVEFNLNKIPNYFKGKTFDFKFGKRKIIIPAMLNGQKEKFLYDSGTSAYELLTNKENWQKLKLPNSKITIEKGNSWGNVLTTYTAQSLNKIYFGEHKISLNQVTYVEGFSKTQYYLMKFSGMSGMLGNRIFLNNEIFIDCKELQMEIQ